MKKLAYALAAVASFALVIPAAPAGAAIETYEARVAASSASAQARADMLEQFGPRELKPGQYVWRDVNADGDPRVVISLDEQLAFLYRGNTLVAAAAISTGKRGDETPPGIFKVLSKKKMHHSRKYDNAPMPHAQFIDQYGVALHAGPNPGRPASHGCVRLPSKFAAKLFEVTELGTPVLIGA